MNSKTPIQHALSYLAQFVLLSTIAIAAILMSMNDFAPWWINAIARFTGAFVLASILGCTIAIYIVEKKYPREGI